MYTRGTLCVTQVSADDSVDGPDYDGPDYDWRDNQDISDPCCYLPHSCGKWIIGGPDEVRAMLDDLTAILANMESGG